MTQHDSQLNRLKTLCSLHDPAEHRFTSNPNNPRPVERSQVEKEREKEEEKKVLWKGSFARSKQ